MSLVPVAIFFAFCIILFVVFKAFNMEALAMGGFVALLIGGIFCKSYTKFWDSAIRGISSISSVSVIVIFFVIGMFSALMKESGPVRWVRMAGELRGHPGRPVRGVCVSLQPVSFPRQPARPSAPCSQHSPSSIPRASSWAAAPCSWRAPSSRAPFSVTTSPPSRTRPSPAPLRSSSATGVQPMWAVV